MHADDEPADCTDEELLALSAKENDHSSSESPLPPQTSLGNVEGHHDDASPHHIFLLKFQLPWPLVAIPHVTGALPLDSIYMR
ncbi:unnamed protein product [Linum trigynum]|uniref:Uncharacterized protein n=1 Tax=Linum trigynum TaxID=586398 RepID=A0AAV2G1P3_9ROSI